LITLLTALISLWTTTTRVTTKGSQNVAELTDGRLLWDRHTKTYSPILQVPQFRRWLRWEVSLVCKYFLYRGAFAPCGSRWRAEKSKHARNSRGRYSLRGEPTSAGPCRVAPRLSPHRALPTHATVQNALFFRVPRFRIYKRDWILFTISSQSVF
jgi:hypothetical protein